MIIALILAIVAIALNFISILWGWSLVIIYAVGLILYLKAIQLKKWGRIPELSDEANAMFNKYGHYYVYQHGAKSFSVSCTLIQTAAAIIAIANIFQKFWWGILFGIIAWVVMSFTAKGFNPTNFLTPEEEDPHQEVVQHIQKKMRAKIAKSVYGNEVPDHIKEVIDNAE